MHQMSHLRSDMSTIFSLISISGFTQAEDPLQWHIPTMPKSGTAHKRLDIIPILNIVQEFYIIMHENYFINNSEITTRSR